MSHDNEETRIRFVQNDLSLHVVYLLTAQQTDVAFSVCIAVFTLSIVNKSSITLRTRFRPKNSMCINKYIFIFSFSFVDNLVSGKYLVQCPALHQIYLLLDNAFLSLQIQINRGKCSFQSVSLLHCPWATSLT